MDFVPRTRSGIVVGLGYELVLFLGHQQHPGGASFIINIWESHTFYLYHMLTSPRNTSLFIVYTISFW